MIGKYPSHELDIRIMYADTDRMGVVYYSNYFDIFERGRTELMRANGLRYRDFEETEKVFLPAVEAYCRYFSPARYDELIRVKTTVKDMGGASIEFFYEIHSVDTGLKIVEGTTRHPFVNEKWKPVRIPKSIQSKLGASSTSK